MIFFIVYVVAAAGAVGVAVVATAIDVVAADDVAFAIDVILYYWTDKNAHTQKNIEWIGNMYYKWTYIHIYNQCTMYIEIKNE